MSIFIVFLISIPAFLMSQNNITINLTEKSIKINVDSSELENANRNWLDDKDYTFIESDTSYMRQYYDCKKRMLPKTDTFHYISTTVIRKKNSIFIIPKSREKQICLNERLKNLSFQEKDSLLNVVLKEQYKRQPSSFNLFKYFELSPVKYYQNKYPYIEIKEVFKEKYKKKNLYTSIATRILVIDGVHYFISVKSESLKSAKSIASSRRAVCRDFKKLVDNITIIDSKN